MVTGDSGWVMKSVHVFGLFEALMPRFGKRICRLINIFVKGLTFFWFAFEDRKVCDAMESDNAKPEWLVCLHCDVGAGAGAPRPHPGSRKRWGR